MKSTNDISCLVPFASGSSFASRLNLTAALGGGTPHNFVLDTGSVGILAPRSILGPDYQDFDPADDISFGYISSGKRYQGQWVNVPVVLGVPPDWDGTGDFPIAQIDVFAVTSRQISTAAYSASASALAARPTAALHRWRAGPRIGSDPGKYRRFRLHCARP